VKWWEARKDCITRSFITSYSKYYLGDQVKGNEKGGSCSMHGRHEKYIQNFGLKTEGKRPLRRLGTNGKIII